MTYKFSCQVYCSFSDKLYVHGVIEISKAACGWNEHILCKWIKNHYRTCRRFELELKWNTVLLHSDTTSSGNSYARPLACVRSLGGSSPINIFHTWVRSPTIMFATIYLIWYILIISNIWFKGFISHYNSIPFLQ